MIWELVALGAGGGGFFIGMIVSNWEIERCMTVPDAERLLRKARAREAAKQAYESKLREP